VNAVSDSRSRINPRHRTLDAERLADALLDLAALVEADEDELELGAQIHARVTPSVERAVPVETVPEEKSA
jgi:hypothetical protein